MISSIGSTFFAANSSNPLTSQALEKSAEPVEATAVANIKTRFLRTFPENFFALQKRTSLFFQIYWDKFPFEVPSSFLCFIDFEHKIKNQGVSLRTKPTILKALTFYLKKMAFLFKKINYKPQEGSNIIVSGCSGLDAIVEYLGLMFFFKDYPSSSFSYISIEKNPDAHRLNTILKKSLRISNFTVLQGSILNVSKIFKREKIDINEVSLFLCCHPPVVSTEYGSALDTSSNSSTIGKIDKGIGFELLDLAANSTFPPHAMCCIATYYNHEMKTLYNQFSFLRPDSKERPLRKMVCKKKHNQAHGTPCVKENQLMDIATQCWNSLRLALVLYPIAQ